MTLPKKIFIFTRCYWTYINFRQDLVNYICKNSNFKITVFMDLSNKPKRVILKKKKNLKFVNFPFLNKKKSLFNDLKNILLLILILKKCKPQIIHNFTARPVIFCSLAAKLFSNFYLINTITGLGTNFLTSSSLKKFFLKILYKYSLSKTNFIIFQNKDDKRFFLRNALISKKTNKKIIFPYINLRYKLCKHKHQKHYEKKKIIFLMFCRLLYEKGIREYYKAAKDINSKFKNKALFYLIGDVDLNNPTSIPINELSKWKKSKNLKILAHQNNIEKHIIYSDVIVFPSYGEGLPSSLLESIYFGKPVITTKVNGCREIVKNKYNGFLVPPQNSRMLKKKMLFFIKNQKLIRKYGLNSKKLFNKKFKKNSFKEYLKIYNKY